MQNKRGYQDKEKAEMEGKSGEKDQESKNKQTGGRKRERNNNRAWNLGGWLKKHRGPEGRDGVVETGGQTGRQRQRDIGAQTKTETES